MLLRLVVCLGMVGFCIWQGIQASMPTNIVRILYSACAILLLSGLNPRGLITWPIASLLLLSRGHWIVGWIPVALVVFNIIGNRIIGSITLTGRSMSNRSDMGLLSAIFGTREERVRKTCGRLYNIARTLRPGKNERDYLKLVLITKPPFDYQYDQVLDSILESCSDIEDLARAISEQGQLGSCLWRFRQPNVKSGRLEARNRAFFAEFWG